MKLRTKQILYTSITAIIMFVISYLIVIFANRQILIAKLCSDNSEMRSSAICTAIEMGKSVVPLLIDVLENNDKPSARYGAAIALGEIKFNADVDFNDSKTHVFAFTPCRLADMQITDKGDAGEVEITDSFAIAKYKGTVTKDSEKKISFEAKPADN